ncbi:GNAT family N-acetyltransferase [Pantoea phytobeneficialis]|uniref:GNAT family N-acetyltransferase n=1 Tax=Pantoea phytobeneficialis TaxID=2052056 RepID=A0AAP9HAW7_9GAMM|nr:GNAT family N-acetyltransferase [Pantoea phytobeneficialis]MDO6406927.1 GNAT family N-acetyltransferase [Pantoea phytobeneficialis]QGR09893.1 GNAT family N-acetyltransferase [Pantoea phytobeneficialis]
MNNVVENLVMEVSDNMTDEQLLPIETGLNAFNDLMTGISDRKPLAVVIKNPTNGEVLGGMQGRTSLGLLFIDLFYLPSSLRKKGLGTELLQRFENEGRKRGCVAGFLYTINFQAPDFYKKHGWEEFGRIDCLPEGTSRIFMRKSLC